MSNPSQIAFIGAGPVAFHLSAGLQRVGYKVCQVISRSALSAERLAQKVGADSSDRITDLNLECDALFLTVPDGSLPDVISQLDDYQGLLIHTSGSFPIQGFGCRRYPHGVFYPLQSFSFGRDLDWRSIPILIEGFGEQAELRLQQMATQLSDRVIALPSGKRRMVHLAAIWANNFSNHMISKSFEIMKEGNIPQEWLHPLVRETLEKALALGPDQAQTGPAKRNDLSILKKHRELLRTDPMLLRLYEIISESIMNDASNPQPSST